MSQTQLHWTEDCDATCGIGRWAVGNDGVIQYSTPIGDMSLEAVAAAFRANYSPEQAAACEVTLYVDGQPA